MYSEVAGRQIASKILAHAYFRVNVLLTNFQRVCSTLGGMQLCPFFVAPVSSHAFRNEYSMLQQLNPVSSGAIVLLD
jgi:hypothetical protein